MQAKPGIRSIPSTKRGSLFVGALLLLSMIPWQDTTRAHEPTPPALPPAGATPGGACPADAPLRSFDVVAINVDVPLNRFGDHVPEGRMYALREDLPRIRAAEALRMPQQGLRDDPIQPLVLRANQGDCVELVFTNLLAGREPASLHVHGVEMDHASHGSAVGYNPDSEAFPDETVRTRVYLAKGAGLEGARLFHSHGDVRTQMHFGLFGALVAEPENATWLNPRTGAPQRSGWDALIVRPDGLDFREYVPIYHSWGDENYQPLDKDDDELPLVDPFTETYRPGGRAVNYRSEPEYSRFDFIEQEVGLEPLLADAFSSYSHGDPAVPIASGYVSDPTKWRLVNADGEVAHVHHIHGGGNRWPFQPATNPTRFGLPLQKGVVDIVDNRSILIDSQMVAPGEVYNIENECGAGGCQAGPGDHLWHCHINEHYPAGMWGMWRVHNTLQPDLVELPDRAGRVRPAVTSVDLLGTTLPNGTTLTADNLGDWVRLFLPPRGVRHHHYDASVMDWTVVETPEGPLYLNEPETATVHPNYVSPTPGERPPILFDPLTKRTAFPLLNPHPGFRPPFPPGTSGHGPSPYLQGRDDGNFDLDRVCPANRPAREFHIRVAQMAIPVTDEGDELDEGIVFTLANEEDALRRGDKPIEPLLLRLNTGDCDRIVLANGLPDQEDQHANTVNLHPHFGQFDPQGSDGAVTGFNFEQAVEPFAVEGTRLAAPARAGDMSVLVEDSSRFHVGAFVALGLDQAAYDIHRIAAIEGNVLVLSEPVRFDQPAGSAASDEFVTHEIYFDFQAGVTYFHDHVSHSHLARGQFGAYVVEPTNSSYRDPRTGRTEWPPGPGVCPHTPTHTCTLTGSQADILTDGPLTLQRPGEPFREQVIIFGDNAPLRHGQRGVTWTNYRAEPLEDREENGERRYALSSVVHGDPFTPVLSAYVGDQMVVRVLTGSLNHIHTFVMPDHLFPVERFDDVSLRAEAYTVGQSERFDLVARAGGLAQTPGDFLWYNGLNRHFEEGSWGLVRVHDTLRADLLPLPGRTPPMGVGYPENVPHGATPARAPDPGNPCPPTAPLVRRNVSLVETDIVFNEREGIKRSNQEVFALDEDIPRLRASEGRGLEPLVLHARLGTCLEVRFTNRVDDGARSLHTALMEKDVRKSSGITAGYNYDQSVEPNESIVYRYFVRDGVPGQEFSLVAEFADPIRSWDRGAYGGINLVPGNATTHDPRTGAHTARGADVAVRLPDGTGYRVFTAVFHDEDERIGQDEMPYPTFVDGIAAINYRMEPLDERRARGLVERGDGDEDNVGDEPAPTPPYAFSSYLHGDPETPVFRAYAGENVTFRAAIVRGEQPHAFHLDGHHWRLTPAESRSSEISVRNLVPVQHHGAIPTGGAGGPRKMSGDYLYGDHRLPFTQAGMWGIFRVYPENAFVSDLVALPRPPAPPPGGGNGTQPPPNPGHGPGDVVARPGMPIRFHMELWNLLDETQSDLQVRVEAPAQWLVVVFPEPIPPLAPGERVNLTVELTPPARAKGSAPLKFLVVFDDGSVQEMGVAPMVHLEAAAAPTPGPGVADGGDGGAREQGGWIRGIPTVATPLLVVLLALAAWARRRRA